MPGRMEFRTTPDDSDSPVTRMTIKSTGNVGIGTTTPNALLTLSSSDEVKIAAYTLSDSNHSTLRLRRVGSGETIVVDGDVLGFISAKGFDGSDYDGGAAIVFSVDGEPGLDDMPSIIEFRTTSDESNDRVERMRIDSEGNVGIGTSSPGQLLDLESIDKAHVSAFTKSDTQQSRFVGRRSRAGNTIVQENDDLVRFIGRGFDGDQTRSAAEIRFKVDGTPGASDMPGRMEFRTTPDDSDSPVTRMVIDNTGKVGIGKSAPGGQLIVEDTDIDGVLLTLQDIDGTCSLDPESGGSIFSCSSDARLKTNIRDAKPVLGDLMTLRVRDFTVKASGDEMTGLVAQEVEEVMPGIVSEGNDGYLMVAEINHWKLVKAIQELKTENDVLRARLADLEGSVGAPSSPAGLFSSGWPAAPWLLWGGLALGGLVLGGLVTGRTGSRVNGKLPLLSDPGTVFQSAGARLQRSGTAGQYSIAPCYVVMPNFGADSPQPWA